MGREIRKVPPNWQQHPVGYNGLQPMYDRHYEDAAADWISEFIKWHVERVHPEYADEESKALPFWDWHGMPPNKQYHRTWKDEEATWFQLWETVSEGTPVSPPFATLAELAAHLAEHGDDWDQKRSKERPLEYPNGPGWGHERAKRFCEVGRCPSMILMGGKVYVGSESVMIAEEADHGSEPAKEEEE